MIQDIFSQYYTALCLFSSKILGDEMLAEDIVQEVFIRLDREMGKKEIQYCRSWLYTAVRNASLNELNKRKRREDAQKQYVRYQTAINNVAGNGAEEHLINAEVSRQLWNGIQKLPMHMQQVVRMHFMESMSLQEISDALHLHISTVKTQKKRGVTLLRKYINFIAILLLFFSFSGFFC